MKTEANIIFGRNLSKLRKAKGFSQEELAFRCGFDRTYIGTIERGEKSATVNSIAKLAKGLEIPMKTFFEYEDGKEDNQQ